MPLFDPATNDPIDRKLDLSREDYRALGKRKEEQQNAVAKDMEPAIPELSQVLATPRPPLIGESKLISISVTEDVPLKDVLLELARLADVDLELDPQITGGIIFRAHERPFNQVIERISDLAGLRYTMKNGVLRVERDLPFVKNYAVGFLNLSRNNTSSVTVNTNVLSTSTGGSGGDNGLTTGSSSTLESVAESDLWPQLEAVLQQVTQRPAQPAAQQNTVAAGVAGAAGAAAGLAAAMPGAAGMEAAVPGSPVNLPALMPSASASAGSGGNDGPFYIMNRQAGLLTVSTTQRQHRVLEEYLRNLQERATAQVLIEAKVVEVALADQFKSGINWQNLDWADKLGVSVNFSNDFASNDLVTFTLGSDGDLGLTGAVNLVQKFGTSRTLSSPRIMAVNNQQAVLTFAENRVYFEIDVQRETDTSVDNQPELLTVDSTVRTVPIGLVLTLQPSINLESSEVTMNIRPTLSRSETSVSDPAVAFLASQTTGLQNLVNEIPVVQVRELDTVMTARSGEVMVIGGLMEDKTSNVDSGVPLLSEIPWIGNAFKSVSKENTVTETIIFLKATIINGKNYDKADREVYQTFTADPRPLAF